MPIFPQQERSGECSLPGVPGRLSRRELMLGTLAAGMAATSAAVASRNTRPVSPAPGSRRFAFPTPIEQVVIAVRENHSYDNIFGMYPHGNGVPRGTPIGQCPDELGVDPSHLHANGIAALQTFGVTTPEAYCVYHEEDVPGYYDLADQFTLCDNFYNEILGPTIPNHLTLLGARPGSAVNPGAAWNCPQACYDIPTLADRVAEVGLTWLHYGHTVFDVMTMIEHLQNSPNLVDFTQFGTDVTGGNLPNLSWLKTRNPYHEHPPFSLHTGHDWMMDRVNAFMASPQWNSALMIIVWDDWGGFYDHVRPPDVEHVPGANDQFRYGYRSGCLLISPYARPGYISSTLYSHASIVALVEALFDLEPLTDLDAHANNMLDCFDFSQPPLRPRKVRKVVE